MRYEVPQGAAADSRLNSWAGSSLFEVNIPLWRYGRMFPRRSRLRMPKIWLKGCRTDHCTHPLTCTAGVLWRRCGRLVFRVQAQGSWNLKAQSLGLCGTGTEINLMVFIVYNIVYYIIQHIVYDVICTYNIVYDMQYDVIYDVVYDQPVPEAYRKCCVEFRTTS